MAARKRNGSKPKAGGRARRPAKTKGTATEFGLEQLVERLLEDEATVKAAQKRLKATKQLISNHGFAVPVLVKAMTLARKPAEDRAKAVERHRKQVDLFDKYLDDLVGLDLFDVARHAEGRAAERIDPTPIEEAAAAGTPGAAGAGPADAAEVVH